MISNNLEDINRFVDEDSVGEDVVLFMRKNGFFDWRRREIVNYIGGFRSGLEVFDYLKASDFFNLSKS